MPWVKEHSGMDHYWTWEIQEHSFRYKTGNHYGQGPQTKSHTIPECVKSLCGIPIPLNNYSGRRNLTTRGSCKDVPQVKRVLKGFHKQNIDKPLKPCTTCYKNMKEKGLDDKEIGE